MEVTGTTHSIQELEQQLIKSFPNEVMHDGSKPFSLFGSKSNQSATHTIQYQLFPFGRKKIWEERVNVRFCYDDRHGTATMRISSYGMHILGQDIKRLMAKEAMGYTPKSIKQ